MNKKLPEVKIVNVQIQRRIPLLPKICPVCGKRFMGAKLAKYDSRQCKLKASYQRHAEERRKHRMERYRAEKKATGGKK